MRDNERRKEKKATQKHAHTNCDDEAHKEDRCSAVHFALRVDIERSGYKRTHCLMRTCMHTYVRAHLYTHVVVDARMHNPYTLHTFMDYTCTDLSGCMIAYSQTHCCMAIYVP